MNDLKFMDLVQEKLDVGLILKNYRDLCRTLGEEIKEGKRNKDFQLKHWARFFSMEKVEGSNKLVITEILDEPLPNEDGRGKHLSKYGNLFDNLILEQLSENDGYIAESYTSLMKNYFDFFTEENDKLFNLGYTRYARNNDIGKGLVMTYQQRMRNVVKTSLETALNRLQRQGIIEYEVKMLIRDRNLQEEYADEKYINIVKVEETKAYEELEMSAFSRVTADNNRRFKRTVTKALDIANYYWIYDIKLTKEIDYAIETDRDELVRRFVKSTMENTKNTKVDSDNGGKYKPYNHHKYIEQIDRLTRLLWELPDDYTTQTEQDTELVKLFGNDTERVDHNGLCYDVEEPKTHFGKPREEVETESNILDDFDSFYDYVIDSNSRTVVEQISTCRSNVIV